MPTEREEGLLPGVGGSRLSALGFGALTVAAPLIAYLLIFGVLK